MSTTNLDSADLKGVDFGGLIREDVMNKIWDISKIPLPFTEMIGTGSAKNEHKEWTTDVLAQPDITNKVVDGADATGNDTETGERVGNHHQMMDKVVKVSHRADVSDTIGRKKELAYQLMRRQQELKRDYEAIMLNNQASIPDNGDAIAGTMGGLPSWLKTNYSDGGGTAGGFDAGTGLTVARIPGTGRALSEAMIRDAVENVYNEGGDPTKLMSIPGVIRKFSEYLFSSSARIATLMSDQGKSREKAAAVGSINVFVTDFGTLTMVPNRLQQKYKDISTTLDVADVFILDPGFLEKCFLQGYRTDSLAKTGTAKNRQMTVDATLIVNTEKAHALIADINPALPAVAG